MDKDPIIPIAMISNSFKLKEANLSSVLSPLRPSNSVISMMLLQHLATAIFGAQMKAVSRTRKFAAFGAYQSTKPVAIWLIPIALGAVPSFKGERRPGSSLASEEVDLEAQNNATGRLRSQRKWKINLPFLSFKLSPRVMSDFTLGMTDGMTVPFALTAGLSFVGSTKIVILGGVAELIGGAISMAIGGALGARGEW